ncbi:MAG: hypothetical protein M5U16_04885 [Hyphomicrobium sp.]|nr:hypothetical protein [Hyphomicrobium sp.]
MAKSITLNDIAAILVEHGKEIRDLTASVAHVVKHMVTKDDIADLKIELKTDIARVQEQVNSIEAELTATRRASATSSRRSSVPRAVSQLSPSALCGACLLRCLIVSLLGVTMSRKLSLTQSTQSVR